MEYSDSLLFLSQAVAAKKNICRPRPGRSTRARWRFQHQPHDRIEIALDDKRDPAGRWHRKSPSVHRYIGCFGAHAPGTIFRLDQWLDSAKFCHNGFCILPDPARCWWLWKMVDRSQNLNQAHFSEKFLKTLWQSRNGGFRMEYLGENLLDWCHTRA